MLVESFISISLSESVVRYVPHQAAMSVSIHWRFPGKYSRKTAVSSTRLPPAPKALKHTNTPNTSQLGLAPATMAKMEQITKDTLNAILRPKTSAPIPQNSAPTSIPTYTAMVRPLG